MECVTMTTMTIILDRARPTVWQISASLGYAGLLLATVLLAVSGGLAAAAVLGIVLVLLTPLLVGLHQAARPQYTPQRAALTHLEPCQIRTATGEVVQGWAVPLDHTDSYQLVLTTQGYCMVNAEGQTIHRFE